MNFLEVFVFYVFFFYLFAGIYLLVVVARPRLATSGKVAHPSYVDASGTDYSWLQNEPGFTDAWSNYQNYLKEEKE